MRRKTDGFVNVQHEYKIKEQGIGVNMLALVENHLANGKRIWNEWVFLRVAAVISRVLRGSVLGPQIFTIHKTFWMKELNVTFKVSRQHITGGKCKP